MIYEIEISRMGAIRLALRLIFCAIWHGAAIIRDTEFEGRWKEEEA